MHPLTMKKSSKKPSSEQDNVATRKSKAKKLSAEDIGIPSNGDVYCQSLKDLETVEYVRCKIRDTHVFKVSAPRQSSGWSATELTEELWQGTVKVVDRGVFSGILLTDRVTDELFAVCPIEEEVERCTDSSRYFIVKVKNARDGKTSRVGLAFNERSQAFDFNIALETSKKEQQARKTTISSTDSESSIEDEGMPESGIIGENMLLYSAIFSFWFGLKNANHLPCVVII